MTLCHPQKWVELYMSQIPNCILRPVNFLHAFVIAVSISELSFKCAKIVSLKFIICENRSLQELEINTCE